MLDLIFKRKKQRYTNRFSYLYKTTLYEKGIEIGQNKILFKYCDSLNDRLELVGLKHVESILYTNGVKDVIDQDQVFTDVTSNITSQKKINNNYGLASFIIFLISICTLYGAIVIAMPVLITGSIARRQFKSNPGIYKNAWMYELGVIIGAILCFLGLLLSLVLIGWLGPVAIAFLVLYSLTLLFALLSRTIK